MKHIGQESNFQTYSMIDPPSPFEPMETWEAFLAELESMNQEDLGVQAALAEAKSVLSTKRRVAAEVKRQEASKKPRTPGALRTRRRG